MLQDRNVDIDKFIKFNAGGIIIADYDQVQATLIKLYRDTYGYDIDLSNTTADGIFVNNLALIINNMLQSFKIVYSNLNVETATGAYLDSLCRLSNVTRKRATQSIAQLLITSEDVNTRLTNGTVFVDFTGNEWVYHGPDIDISPSDTEAKSITVTCTQYGPIEASKNSITQTLEASYLTVSQPSDAIVGSNDETDEELRARRDQSNGSQGVTVLESLVGALLAVEGIDDVQIINNNTSESHTNEDTTVQTAHSVYVIIRKADNVEVTDKTIGSIIYNAMTPGISTTPFTGTNGTAHSHTEILDPNISFITQNVYWKQATPIAPTVKVTITTGRDYTDAATQSIGQAVIEYLNNIKLSQIPTSNDLIITATYADTTATYVVKSVSMGNSLTNPNTYYYYTTWTTATSGNDIELTFA